MTLLSCLRTMITAFGKTLPRGHPPTHPPLRSLRLAFFLCTRHNKKSRREGGGRGKTYQGQNAGPINWFKEVIGLTAFQILHNLTRILGRYFKPQDSRFRLRLHIHLTPSYSHSLMVYFYGPFITHLHFRLPWLSYPKPKTTAFSWLKAPCHQSFKLKNYSYSLFG